MKLVKCMNRKATILAAVAFVLVMCMGIAPAWAYFTDTTNASGTIPIGIEPSTDITEEFDELGKHVTIVNDEDATAAVFVRVRVYSPVECQVAGEGWSGPEDGWYYYGEAVAPGGKTTVLDAKITFPKAKESGAAEGAEVGDNFNVIVVYESTPAVYDENGNPAPDWNNVLDSGEDEGGR